MRSLSLKAYRALARGTRKEPSAERPKRPQGLLIWGNAHDDASLKALIYLVQRLRHLRGPCQLLVTGFEAKRRGEPSAHDKFVIFQPLPEETTADTQNFLAYWKPDFCLWVGGNLMPLLICECHELGTPMYLLDVKDDLIDQPMWRWLPNLARETLSCFDLVTVNAIETRRHLRKIIGGKHDIEVTAPLQVSSAPPSVNEAEHEDLSEALAGRPLWLASHVQKAELSDVLAAHRTASTLTHRLLLILVTANFPISLDARAILKSQGWRVCHWDDGEEIDENTQVVLVEEPEQMGLWYRLSPVTFLASSIAPGHGGVDPYVPASLGSAVIYGPNVGAHLGAYTRLASVGAARIVNEAAGLARALAQLLASDQAASMAHAAWVAISDGAESTDRIIDAIQERLDDGETIS